MSELEESSQHHNEPWVPDESFYTQNPRSKKNREVSLAIIKALEDLLNDPSLINDPERQKQLYSELERYNGELIDLGIKVDMHLGETLSAFQANPETAAKFLAGQLIGLTGRRISSETSMVRTMEEFKMEKSDKRPIIGEPKDLPSAAIDYMTTRTTVNMISEMFAAPQPPTKPQEESNSA